MAKAKKKTQRGGARTGAGRKRLGDNGREKKARYVAYLHPSKIDPLLEDQSFTQFVESKIKK